MTGMQYEDDEDAKMVCDSCIGESYLSRQIEESDTISDCHYCDRNGPCWSLSEIAQAVEAAFEVHYARTSDEPDALQSMMLRDKESSYDWERDGEQTIYAIMGAIDSEEKIAADLQELLAENHSDWDAAKAGEECEFDEDAHYEEISPSDGEWHAEWRAFEGSLKHESRFFNVGARAHLQEIFGELDNLETRDGRPLIVHAGPDAEISSFYRARVFFSDEELRKGMERPDQQLGPPPAHLARAGRMNAHGVSVFYGADSVEGALAEVRPPVGSQTLIGRFNLVRPLSLLDFSALRMVQVDGSIFDPSYADKLAHMMFVSTLSRRISRPIMPTDEDFEYLATQAVADFLASSTTPSLDGVLFPSAQTNTASVNVVLFHKASRVAEFQIPEGTEINSDTHMDTSDGPERDYHVIEWTPPEEDVADEPRDLDPFELPSLDWVRFAPVQDSRKIALAVNTPSLSVHVVKAASYNTDEFAVGRRRYTRHRHDPF